ncbi:hypothetical protein HYW67_04135 [Candidatus Parcubacteria bacterium]|nr:hypothetical protein [Candidatus Parcubacteria bacterium]
MDVIGIDAEAAEIEITGVDVSVKPTVSCYLHIKVDSATRLVSASAELAWGKGGQELTIHFEDPIPYDALPRRGEIGVELRDLLNPQYNFGDAVGMSLAGFFALDAELVITCDDPTPTADRTVRLRIGELYEETVELPYREIAPFLEGPGPEADAEALRQANRVLGPLTDSVPSTHARLLLSVADERLPRRTE